MKQTLKLLTLFISFCGLLLTASCNKEKDEEIPTSWFDGTITAIVENGNDYDDLIDNMSLKKGWNKVYRHWSENGLYEVSTKAVSGLKWYFDDDGY